MRCGLIIFAVLALTAAASAQSVGDAYPDTPRLKTRAAALQERHRPSAEDTILWQSNGELPLGEQTLLLSRQKQRITLLVSAESSFLDGLIAFRNGDKSFVVHRDGSPVRRLPPNITFRVTASGLLETDDAPFPIDTAQDVETFLRSLRFSAKVFHPGGLTAQSYAAVVRNVGVPLDIPSEERIYRASFNFGRLNANDHIVLFVSAPDGERIGKFFLQFD